MSWLSKLGFSKHTKARVDRGLLIPRVTPVVEPAPVKKPTTTALTLYRPQLPALRPTMALAAMALMCFVVYAKATAFVDARFSQTAAPIVVASDTWPYQQRQLEIGPLPALSDQVYFNSLVSELARMEPQLIAVDVEAQQLTVYQSGEVALVAPIQKSATLGSWRNVPAGYYEAGEVQSERYSSLEQAYYEHVVTINQRSAIHGTAHKNDGAPVDAASLGITLSNTDAAAVAAFATTGVPMLLRTSSHVVADTPALTPRGPILGVRSYGVYDLKTENPLASYQDTATYPIASLTKLMTALVVAEEYDLEGEIDIHQERYADSLVPRLGSETRTSVYDLLQLLLLESSNEAAEVLASHMGRERFIALMNEQAAVLGMQATTYADPSGIDNGNQSSVADLYTLTQYIYEQYPFLLTLTAQENAVEAARVSDFTNLQNFNEVSGLTTFVGGKIGETEAARQTSITVHEFTFGTTIRPIVIIVLGSESRAADVTTLHNYIQNRYGN